jgi:hypothetical protein
MNKKTYNNNKELLLAFRRSFDVYLERVSNSKQTIHIKELSFSLLDKVGNWIEHRGNIEAVRRLKFIKSQLIHIFAGSEPIRMDSTYPIYRDGYPKDLGPKVTQILREGDIDSLRDVLTLLQVSYIITGWKEPDYSEIEKPSASDINLEKDIVSFVKSQQFIKFDAPTIYWSEPHPTSKMGPNGPALVCAHDDLFALSEERISQLSEFAGNRFAIYLENCIGARDYLKAIRKQLFPVKGDNNSSREIIDSRISIVKSPECKSRIIAIFDYWSQTVLKPLHDWAFAQLRKFPSDRTFQQNRINPSKGAGPFYSFDLKSATDRFPVSLQESILALYINEKRASAWRSIMTDRYFLKHDRSGTVKYETGQPMGAYSSWAIFSITHHFVVQYAASISGKTGMFTDYLLLGDDIVIYDREVAANYESVINSLGVEIQKEKSLVSNDTFEFAKRVFHKGKEITGFPLAAFVANHKSVSALWSVTLVCRERGFDRIHPYAIPGFVKSIQSSCGVTLRSTSHIAKYYEAYRVLINHGPDHSLLNWSLDTIHKTLDRERPCRSNLIQEKQELIWDLGYFTMGYKASLVDNAYRKFIELSYRITGQNWTAGGIEGISSQVAAPIDMMRIPIVWVSRLMAEQQRIEIQTLKGYAEAQQFEAFLSLPVSPIGDLTRLMSHQVNKTSLARHDAMMKSIRTRQKHLNQLLSDAYQAPDVDGLPGQAHKHPT